MKHFADTFPWYSKTLICTQVTRQPHGKPDTKPAWHQDICQGLGSEIRCSEIFGSFFWKDTLHTSKSKPRNHAFRDLLGLAFWKQPGSGKGWSKHIKKSCSSLTTIFAVSEASNFFKRHLAQLSSYVQALSSMWTFSQSIQDSITLMIIFTNNTSLHCLHISLCQHLRLCISSTIEKATKFIRFEKQRTKHVRRLRPGKCTASCWLRACLMAMFSKISNFSISRLDPWRMTLSNISHFISQSFHMQNLRLAQDGFTKVDLRKVWWEQHLVHVLKGIRSLV